MLGCTVLLIYAFGLHDGMAGAEHWEFDKINHYESKLIVDNGASASHINNVVKKVDGDRIMESGIEIEANSTKKSASLLVLNDTDLITPTNIHQMRLKLAMMNLQSHKKWLICWVWALETLSGST